MESKESATKVDCETGNCAVEEDVMDWKTFTPPIQSLDDSQNRILPGIVIEFCNRCRWLHRATWIQTELFLTFEDKQVEQEVKGKYATSQGLKSIQLIPCNAPETGGRFRVWLYRGESKDVQENEEKHKNSAHGTFANGKVVLLWDRKIRGGFPELKELKQMVRDEIAPQHNLGHSDRKH